MKMTNPNDFAFNAFETRIIREAKDGTREYYQPPLTKREYFAAMAMQGLLAASWNTSSNEIVTSKSVTIADALINALNQQQ